MLDKLNSLKEIFHFLKEKINTPQAIIEAEWILCEVLNLPKTQLYFNIHKQIDKTKKEKIIYALQRRLQKEPLQYIFGKTNFYGLDIFVGKGVLIPRQETEVLVENALKIINCNDKILDICTGSGAIPLAIYSQQQNINITATDLSLNALKFAQKNISYHHAKISLIQSNLFENIPIQKFNLITANPPYISSKNYVNLPIEIKDFEPKLALLSGEDGLDLIKKIIQKAKEYLTKDGHLLLEVCSTHIIKVIAILEIHQYKEIKILKDYTQKPRFLLAKTNQ